MLMEGKLEVGAKNMILVDGAQKQHDSPACGEVSGSCVNSIVEVFGSIDGTDEDKNDVGSVVEHLFGISGDLGQEYVCEEVEVMPHNAGTMNIKNEEEVEFGVQKCTFNLRDLVWVKARTQVWWPGIIADPDANKNATNSEKRGPFLVKYFGNPYFTWCSTSDLRPFRDYYEHMSRQNTSRNFVGSVDKALGEFGKRVKLKMTCPCLLKESLKHSVEDKEENSTPMIDASEFDDLSLSRFETAKFYSRLKVLACGFSVPSKIELTEAQICLSAFYRSIGHYQLPMQLLRPSADTPLNAQKDEAKNICGIGGSEDNFVLTTRKKRQCKDDSDPCLDTKPSLSVKEPETRERKKSKYLSYPYVSANRRSKVSSNVGQHEKDDQKNVSSQSGKKTESCSLIENKSQRNWSRSSFKGNHIISKADNIDACSAELLTELRLAARDWLHLSRGKYSNSLKQFYTSFRMYICSNLGLAHKNVQHQPCNGKHHSKNSFQKKRRGAVSETMKKDEGIDPSFAGKNLDDEIPEKDDLLATLKRKVRRRKKKEKAISQGPEVKCDSLNIDGVGTALETENDRVLETKKNEGVISPGTEPKSDLFDIDANVVGDSRVISFQLPCSDGPKKKKRKAVPKKKKMVGAAPECIHFGSIAGLPDLNGNIGSISFENVPVAVPTVHKGIHAEKSEEGLVSPMVNCVNHTQMNSSESIFSSTDVKAMPQSTLKSAESVYVQSVPSMANAVIDSSVQDSLQSRFIPNSDCKPKRKRRSRKDKICQVAAAIPDLNGTVADSSALENTAGVENHTSPEGKPTQRRRIGPNGEDAGAILLLNFAPEHPLPSKDPLVATFSRFGLLRASETQVLNETSAQIFYERTSDAQFACRSLEKSSPFGDSLVGFKLHRMPAAPVTVENHKKPCTPQPVSPAPPRNVHSKQSETPDLRFIKQNVEMMKMTLAKAGNDLSPKMRAKLENEIQGFLSRIGSMNGSPSS